MTPLRRISRLRPGIGLFLMVAWLGCKSAPPTPKVEGLQLTEPDQNRGNLIVSAGLRSFEGSLARVGQLTDVLGLPRSTEDLRQMLIEGSELPPEMVQHLDFTQPVGLAFVRQENAEPGTEPHGAIAAAAQTAEAATRFIQALGTETGRDENAVNVQHESGKKFWVLQRKALLVVSKTMDGLLAAGGHALAARDEAREDLTIKVFPEALAQNQGVNIQDFLAATRADIAEKVARSQPNQTPEQAAATKGYMEATAGAYINWIEHTKAAELGIVIDAQDGLHFKVRIHPRAGTPLADQYKAGPPAELDPGMATGEGRPMMLGAMRYSEGFLQNYLEAIRAMGKSGIRGADQVAAGTERILTLIQTHQSFRLEQKDKALAISSSMPLRSGAAAKDVWDAMQVLLADNGLGQLMSAMGPHAPKFGWKHKGNDATLTLAYPNKKGDEVLRALRNSLTAFFGSPTITAKVRIQDGRMVSSTDPGADKRIRSILKPSTAAPPPEIKLFLEETAGSEGFLYVDLLGLFKLGAGAAAATDPSAGQMSAMLNFIPGLDKKRLAVLFSYRGGDHLATDLHFPMRTFQAVGDILKPLRGMGIGGPPAGQP